MQCWRLTVNVPTLCVRRVMDKIERAFRSCKIKPFIHVKIARKAGEQHPPPQYITHSANASDDEASEHLL